MLKDLLYCIYGISLTHNRFFQFHDSTHGISANPIGWRKMSSFQRFTEIRLSFTVNRLQKKTDTQKNTRLWKCPSPFANVYCVYIVCCTAPVYVYCTVYCVQYTSHVTMHRRINGLAKRKMYRHQIERWNEKLVVFEAKNFSQNNNAQLCMFGCVRACICDMCTLYTSGADTRMELYSQLEINRIYSLDLKFSLE